MEEFAEMAEKAAGHDADAFTALMQSQMQNMYKTARAILSNESDIADAISETILTCWEKLEQLNRRLLKNREHSRCYYWEEEKTALLPLPAVPYEYMEHKEAKVSSDFHVRFDNAYYSVDKAFKHQSVSVRASATTVKIIPRKES